MNTPLERVQSDLKEAMKARDTERLGTLRMLLSMLKNAAIDSGKEIDEKAFMGIVRKAVKQRKDAAEQYHKGERPELAEKEEREVEILTPYLPQQASEAEIRQAVEAFVQAEGLSGPQAMGQVMKAVLGKFGGSADGSVVSRIARQVLSS